MSFPRQFAASIHGPGGGAATGNSHSSRVTPETVHSVLTAPDMPPTR